MQSINVVLERQLLMQLGDRIRRLRKARGIGTVEMAKRAGITRNTLRAVESGDPGTAIGIYLHVMSILGVGSEFALLASDSVSPPPTDSASARTKRPMPVVRVHVSADEARHRVQDLQSLAMHEEAVRLVKANPWLIEKAQETTNRWLATDDPYSAEGWREWQNILKAGSWRESPWANSSRSTAPSGFAFGNYPSGGRFANRSLRK